MNITTKNILATLTTSTVVGAALGLMFLSTTPTSQRRLRSIVKDHLLQAIGLHQALTSGNKAIITDHGINEAILVLYKFTLAPAKQRMAIGGTIGGTLGAIWLLFNYFNDAENRSLKKEIDRLEGKVESLEREIGNLRRPLNSSRSSFLKRPSRLESNSLHEDSESSTTSHDNTPNHSP